VVVDPAPNGLLAPGAASMGGLGAFWKLKIVVMLMALDVHSAVLDIGIYGVVCQRQAGPKVGAQLLRPPAAAPGRAAPHSLHQPRCTNPTQLTVVQRSGAISPNSTRERESPIQGHSSP